MHDRKPVGGVRGIVVGDVFRRLVVRNCFAKPPHCWGEVWETAGFPLTWDEFVSQRVGELGRLFPRGIHLWPTLVPAVESLSWRASARGACMITVAGCFGFRA